MLENSRPQTANLTQMLMIGDIDDEVHIEIKLDWVKGYCWCFEFPMRVLFLYQCWLDNTHEYVIIDMTQVLTILWKAARP